MNKLRIYCDGGARGNPGPAASGSYLIEIDKEGNEEKVIDEVSLYLGNETNNVAEYTSVLIGLERAIALGYEDIDVVMDSELVVKQLNGEYKVKAPHLAEIYLKVWQLKPKFKNITFRHVRREFNKEADRLVNEVLDNVSS